jgi:hypothetical protein
MSPVVWMVGGGLLTSLAIVSFPGVGSDREVLLGMLAPLVATTGTWVLVERTYRWRPERLTPLMVIAFGAKMVFFGVYVTLMLTVLTLRPVPFVISFTAYFIALYAVEAFYLRRLFEST